MKSIFRIIFLLSALSIVVSSCGKKAHVTPMPEETYSVRVQTEPEGGTIYLKNKYQGIAPLTLDVSLSALTDIYARKDSYVSTGEQIINFGKGRTAALTLLMATTEEDHKEFPGSPTDADLQELAKLEECKTARTVAKVFNAPSIAFKDSSVYFQFEKSILTSAAIEVLEELAPHVHAAYQAGMIIAVEGHTDRSGPDDYNDKLSGQRVEAVVDYFVNHPTYNVPREYFWVHGWGEKCPLYSKEDQVYQKRDRRTDIILLPRKAQPELPE